MMRKYSSVFYHAFAALLMLSLLLPQNLPAAKKENGFDEKLYDALEYRLVGPFRGGRSAAVTGVPGKPMLYYFGATGGGVWRTTDGGQSWENISDGFFGGSIGAVAVSEWDPNVIYVGEGEVTVRGNVSSGFGMWKSVDAGKTWTHIGLDDSRHITRIRIHPRNPDLVYAAVLGHLYGPNQMRGVYRSKDGGATWQRILFANENAGAVDLIMDPTNPRILYASTWRVRRTPYSLESGGEGSHLWKSTDGGDTWKKITRNKGLPQTGTVGIIGVTVSPVNPDRVWAIIEHENGGVFRSEDGGETWRKINSERKLRQRAWYYSRIYADPQNEDIIYALNVRFWRSKDGGTSWQRIATPHGDHHDLWIAPEDPQRMIVADDGGAQVTVNGGQGWTTYHNQPTAQFYRVTTDDSFPYRIYGAQQDNSTVRIKSRSDRGGITERDWEPSAGGESGWLAPDPKNNDIVYGGSYGGFLTRVNHATGEVRSVNVWPDNPMGHGAEGMNPRFQWNFPILFSRHDPNVLYTAGNFLFKTTNEGQSWERISPDLTRNDPSRLGPSGGPITKDNTGVEYYSTIFAVAESVHEPGVIWAGSDDGLIHITRDGGKTWQNVTPPKKIMPEWIQINSIEAHPFEKGGLYVAATMYKSDDFAPYLYKTTDYGKSWKKITKGIDAQHFTRVIRADPKRRGLLYAGTEYGMYISFDDGANWQKFQLNLPIVPITDLAIKNDDLVVATQGRSFWVLDDLTPLHELDAEIAGKAFHLFSPRPAYRVPGFSFFGPPKNSGQNPPNGVVLHYYFKDVPDSASVRLVILQQDGEVIRSFSPRAKKKPEQMAAKAGMNRFVWNMRYPDAESFKGLIMWAGSVRGPKAAPGQYQARLVVGSDSVTVPFEIRKDPRSSSSEADLRAQFDFLIAVRDKLSETHKTIKEIRAVRKQVKDIQKRTKTADNAGEIKAAAKAFLDAARKIEQALYQTKNQSRQDPLNFPIRLNNKLAALASVVARGDFRPTDQAVAVKKELTAKIDAELARWQELKASSLDKINALVKAADIPAIQLQEDK